MKSMAPPLLERTQLVKKNLYLVSVAALLAGSFMSGCSSDAEAGETAKGTWADTAGSELVLADEGALSGTDGCNRLMGTWSETDGVITFSEVASTKMFCDGVDTWLSGLATAEIDGDTMTVLDDAGTTIGTLER